MKNREDINLEDQSNSHDDQRYWTIYALSLRWNKHPKTLYSWIRTGKLNAFKRHKKKNSTWYISHEEMLRVESTIELA